MRIERYRSGLNFRRRRRSGCLSTVMLMGILVGVAALAWNWVAGWLNSSTRVTNNSLAAAQAAFDAGDLESAIDLARQVFSESPTDFEALTLLARALVYRSYSDYDRAVDREVALELTTEALDDFPNNADVLAIHAFVLQANDQPNAAAQTADRVLETQPDHTLARLSLALAYGGVGGYDVALREMQNAATLPGYAVDVQRGLAIAYSDLGRYPEAITAIQRAITFNNHLLPLYFERALYSMQIGDADSATVAYFQVLAYDPNNVKARLRLCELSSMLRERETAVTYCTEVTQRAPNWAEGWYRLGREYFLQGNFAAAQNNLHRCSTLQTMQNVPIRERRFECWYLQGQAAEILGDCDGLIATYNEFLTMATDSGLQQTWSYPPEGPPMCAQQTSTP
ncbi:MAG: tetratricopeptide repeat protein [Anaerolineae bacterium]